MKITEGVSILMLVWSSHMACSAPLCLIGDFDSQVQHLLAQEMLTPQQVHNITDGFHDLQDQLRSRWGGAEVFLYGSLPAGLATKTSDVDLYAQIPNYNDTADAYIVIETAKLLQACCPAKFGNVRPKIHKEVAVMSYYDIPKQLNVDLTFRSNAWRNTKLISYFMHLDKRYIPLTAVIKFWGKVHHLTGKITMPDYAIYILVVLYLQQKKMAPSVSAVQANLPPLIDNQWDTNFEEIPYSVENNETLYELLGGFFKYYSEFDFKDYCVSAFAGRPIARKDFKNLDTVPEEFSFYKTHISGGNYQSLSLEADVCIQDVFEHNSNIGYRAKKASVLKFINYVKYAAKMYNELPSDRFLGSIFVEDKYSENRTKPEVYEKNTNLRLQDCIEY